MLRLRHFGTETCGGGARWGDEAPRLPYPPPPPPPPTSRRPCIPTISTEPNAFVRCHLCDRNSSSREEKAVINADLEGIHTTCDTSVFTN